MYIFNYFDLIYIKKDKILFISKILINIKSNSKQNNPSKIQYKLFLTILNYLFHLYFLHFVHYPHFPH